MYRLLLLFIILGFIISSLIFINWNIIKAIPKPIIIGVISGFLAILALIFIIKLGDDNRYKTGTYKPAYFENGILKKQEIEND